MGRVRDFPASGALVGTERFYADNGTLDVYVTPSQIKTFSQRLDWAFARDFGAVGDGVTDDTQAIQNAVDYALQFNIPTVYLAAGKYKTTNTIHLGYGISFCTVSLYGPPPEGGYTLDARAVLLPTFLDRPVVNIQGIRHGGLENIVIVGPVSFTAPQQLGPNFQNNLVNYTPLGAKTTIKAPYCAVCIDGYSGSTPANNYPLPTLPAFLGGGTGTYGRLTSSTAIVRKCYLLYTYIGVCISPNSNANSDYVDCQHTHFERLAYSITFGASNCRATNVSDTNHFDVGICFDGQSYLGSSNFANVGGHYDNIHIRSAWRIFNYLATIGTPIAINNLYMETGLEIGSWDGTSGSGDNFSEYNHPIFIGSQFDFINAAVLNNSSQAVVPERISDSCQYLNCRFTGYTSSFVFGNCKFSGCYFEPTEVYGTVNLTAFITAEEKTAVWGSFGGVIITPHVHPGASNFARCALVANRTASGMNPSEVTQYDGWDNGQHSNYHSIGAAPGTSKDRENLSLARTPYLYIIPNFARADLLGDYTNDSGFGAATHSGRGFTENNSASMTVGDVISIEGNGKIHWYYLQTQTGVGPYAQTWVALNDWQFALTDGNAANLVPYSEQWEQTGFWNDLSDGTITVNSTIDTRGNTLADSLVANSTNAPFTGNFNALIAVTANATYTMQCEVKPGSDTTVSFAMNRSDFTGSANAKFSLSGGGSVTSSSGTGGCTIVGSPSITAIANGFYRCVYSFTVPTSRLAYYIFSDSAVSHTNGVTALVLGGTQIEAGAIANAYYPQAPTFSTNNHFGLHAIVTYYPCTPMQTYPRQDGFITKEGSTTVQYVDSNGAPKTIPAGVVTTGRSVFWYGDRGYGLNRLAFAFPIRTLVNSVSTNTFVMSAAATRSGLYPVNSGLGFDLGRKNKGSTLTIATGVIIVTSRFHYVDTEAAAATDDLDTINGGGDGEVLTIKAANSARTVVAKDGTGNLKLAGDFSLDNAEDTITLIFDATAAAWLEMSRSDNGA